MIRKWFEVYYIRDIIITRLSVLKNNKLFLLLLLLLLNHRPWQNNKIYI